MKISINRLLGFFSEDIGVDLGTANTLFYVKHKGIVLNEPTVIAINNKNKSVCAVGNNAKKMIGKTPKNIDALRPLKDGVIADYEVTEKMLKEFFKIVSKKKLFTNPRVVICVPAGVTQVEKRAVMDVAKEAGSREVYLIEEPMAAAIGAGLDIFEPHGNMIVDIGGGTTEIAVISLGGVVQTHSLRVAGDKLDDAIVEYVKKKHNLLIGNKTAEDIKVNVATAEKDDKEIFYEVRGRNILSGLPRNIKVSSKEIGEAISDLVYRIVEEVHVILEKTPPELSADIYQKGLVLAGGGALIKNLDKKISQEIEIPVLVAENPLECVVTGIGKLLEDFEYYKGVLISPETDY
ncbi:rod shape-determining protein [Haliovirga abyssi]|uniref:Cell shape-determining protein MreB n=1 Tax=Haliovirga abyssi TaxID=2996794 RepID=A0AAU9D4Q1_9FUSO|nr:rod shape-determining protein [Haliovirga abyssi]BDU50929.1 rod shape-determining protein [Haliovirga abyssi]